MREWRSQSQVRWYCKRSIYGSLRRNVRGLIRELRGQHGVESEEGHAMPDHVHLCPSIPPQFGVANPVGFLKGKSAIRIHRDYLKRKKQFTGFHFWARGYCFSTIGLDEQVNRAYIRNQEAEGKRQEELPDSRVFRPFHKRPYASGGLHQTARSAGGI